MPVRQLAGEYAARTGTKVDVVSDTAGGVQKRMEAGEALRSGDRHHRRPGYAHQAAEGLGPAQPSGAHGWPASARARARPSPAIADAAAVKATLLAAKSITYVDPASGGITGVFFLSQADKLGIGQEVRAKAVLESQRHRRGRGGGGR